MREFITNHDTKVQMRDELPGPALHKYVLYSQEPLFRSVRICVKYENIEQKEPIFW